MIDLSDTTFMIPVKIESEDRVNNLNIVATYLREQFDTQIIIAEQGDRQIVPQILSKSLFDLYVYYKNNFHFHKTKLINTMVKFSNTPYVIMHDSDVLMEPDQYLEAINMLRMNKVDFVYPFNGKCVNVPKSFVPKIIETLNFKLVRAKYTNQKDLALGGCVAYNRDKFIEAGMMNEILISYGPEDGEQDLRLKKLGYRTNRINKPLYHIEHSRTENSSEGHQHSKQNWQEMQKVRNMSDQMLRNYISSWPWLK